MVVKRVTVSDSLGWEKFTEYYYHDGYYDGCEAEFRGYQEAEVREIGDANSPTSWTRTRFHVGAREEGTQCLDDNPYEGLKGEISWSETFDDFGIYLKTEWFSYRSKKLYEGLDGRGVWHTYSNANGTFLYDTSNLNGYIESACQLRPEIEFDTLTGTSQINQCVPLHSYNYVELKNENTQDTLGNITRRKDYGALTIDGDETEGITIFGTIGSWISRLVSNYIVGHPEKYDSGNFLNYTINKMDAKGMVKEIWEIRDISLPEGVSPPTSGWEIDYGFPLLKVYYNYAESGQKQEMWEGVSLDGWEGNRPTYYKKHARWRYDNGFGAYLAEESIEVRNGEYVTSFLEWDGGFNKITAYVDYNGKITSYRYDSLGRIEKIYFPSCSEPGYLFRYNISSPLSIIETVRNETCQEGSIEGIIEPSSPPEFQGLVEYTIIDGLERERGSIKEGDERHPWIVEEHGIYDAKGFLSGLYLPYGINSLSQFDARRAPQPLMTRIIFDAFGRTLREYSADGEDYKGTNYGLLRNEIYTMSDNVPGVYFGTTKVQFFDGQQRMIKEVEKVRKGDGSIEYLATSYQYSTLGDIVVIRKGRLAGDEESEYEGYVYQKIILQDSFGLDVYQNDPDRGELYHIYNDIGDLVRFQDGRGITNAYSYDLAGRLVAEDYGNDGIPDVIYGYDLPFSESWYHSGIICHSSGESGICPLPQRNLTGELSWVESRSGTKIFSYDDHGMPEWVDVQLSSYEYEEGLNDWIRRDDHSQIWHNESEYDEIGRPVWEDFPQDGKKIFYYYSSRGLLDAMYYRDGSFSDAIPIIRKIDYDETGREIRIDYGDVSGTVMEYAYDARKRLVNLLAHQGNFIPEGSDLPQRRVLLNYTYRYDVANNISFIGDNRVAEDSISFSPVPVNYYYSYDSANRLIRATPVYHIDQPDRVKEQRWDYDKLGSSIIWTDDDHRFFEWSLGSIKNGLQLMEEDGINNIDGRTPAPHALYRAYDINPSDEKMSFLRIHYDKGGYLTQMNVYRECVCDPEDSNCHEPCVSAQMSLFQWDEVGRLSNLKKYEGIWDGVNGYNFPEESLFLNYQYTCDSSDTRTIKKKIDTQTGNSEYSLYINSSFEIYKASLSPNNEFSDGEINKYLMTSGRRIARVIERGGEEHVLLYLANHLSSTAAIVDRVNGDVVMARTDLPFGGKDEAKKDDSWEDFEAKYTFIGKEEDEGADVMYFGKRYYFPGLGRWASPDPKGAVGGSDINCYRYSLNNPLNFLDPTGTQEQKPQKTSAEDVFNAIREFAKNYGKLYKAEASFEAINSQPYRTQMEVKVSYSDALLKKGYYKCNIGVFDALSYVSQNTGVKYKLPIHVVTGVGGKKVGHYAGALPFIKSKAGSTVEIHGAKFRNVSDMSADEIKKESKGYPIILVAYKEGSFHFAIAEKVEINEAKGKIGKIFFAGFEVTGHGGFQPTAGYETTKQLQEFAPWATGGEKKIFIPEFQISPETGGTKQDSPQEPLSNEGVCDWPKFEVETSIPK